MPRAVRARQLAGWGISLALALVVVAQELRWQLAAPFSLAGLSHAVGVPEGVTLTAGFALRNDSRLTLEIRDLVLQGDVQRAPQDGQRSPGELDYLSVIEVMALRGIAEGEAVPAMPGTMLERQLRGGDPVGQRLRSGEAMELAVGVVGDAPGEYGLGPFEIRYRWGPLRGEQRVSLPRDYRVRVTAIEGAGTPLERD